MEKITREMKIGDAVKVHPEVAKIMFEYGLHCIGCAISPFESVEDGAKSHGMDDAKINEMVEKINKAIESEKEESKS